MLLSDSMSVLELQGITEAQIRHCHVDLHGVQCAIVCHFMSFPFAYDKETIIEPDVKSCFHVKVKSIEELICFCLMIV